MAWKKAKKRNRGFYGSSKREKKSTKKKRGLSSIRKKNIRSKTTLSNVIEINLYSPLKGKKGVMEIRFRFTSIKGRKIISIERTGRSNKLFFPRQRRRGYDQCLQRAMAQNIPFSPDDIKIVRISYFYWEPLR